MKPFENSVSKTPDYGIIESVPKTTLFDTIFPNECITILKTIEASKIMALRLILIVFFTVLVSGISFGQTENDFEKNYGSEKYYEIRPKISMQASFDKDGQVCRVTLIPSRISKKKNTNYLGNYYLEPLEVMEIIDELIPPAKREGKGTSLGFRFTRSMGFGAYKWDNVQINIDVSFGRSSFRQSTTYPKPAADINPDDLGFLIDSMGGFPEIVIISWTKRQCQ